MRNPSTEYAGRLSTCDQRVIRYSRLDSAIAYSKIALVSLIASAIWWIHKSASFYALASLAATLLIFGALLVLHESLLKLLKREQRRSALYRRGLDRIEDRWAGTGENGNQFHAVDHIYADDLDLLGDGSLYQLLCTCRTRMGKGCLAEWMLTPPIPRTIVQRQDCVKELRDKLDFREDLAIVGESEHLQSDPVRLAEWASEDQRLEYRRWWPVGILLAIGSIVSCSYGLASSNWLPFLNVLIACCIVFMIVRRRVTLAIGSLNNAFRDLSVLADFIERIERESFNSDFLKSLQQQLATDELPASECIRKLSVVAALEQSRHSFIGRVIDKPLMYSLQVACALERWRAFHGSAVPAWLQALGELESLIALSYYSFEHPQDPFPEILSEKDCVCFRGISLGHPLMPATRFVGNDLELDHQCRIFLISGSNMSGKSTFLRVVGINAVLALMGAPVRAEALQMSPILIGATIRISDSLQTGVSRFYAEIKRIRCIVELAAQTPLLFLFDEVLQGTNSSDRRVGLEGILKTLLACNSIGLATTHDLALTAIANRFPAHIRNVHFREQLNAGHLTFDYQLRDGVSTTSNGVELMRSIGLAV
jgi:hypothetical protein